MATVISSERQQSSSTVRVLQNYVNGKWVDSDSTSQLDVRNPATGQLLARVPLSTKEDVNRAVAAARAAFPSWRATPVLERARYLFKMKNVMEDHFEELALILVEELGKALPDARAEIRRGIEMVEVATGMPSRRYAMPRTSCNGSRHSSARMRLTAVSSPSPRTITSICGSSRRISRQW